MAGTLDDAVVKFTLGHRAAIVRADIRKSEELGFDLANSIGTGNSLDNAAMERFYGS